MMYKADFYLVFFCSVFACSTKKGAVSKVWFYNDDQTQDEKIENIMVYKSMLNHDLTDADFLNLQPDSTFTSFFSSFNYGKWFINDSVLVLMDHYRHLQELSISRLDDHEMICLDKKRGIIYRFKGYATGFSSSSDNPFSGENNQWRLKAKHKESEAEIAARLRNHFRYWEKFFNWGLKTDIGQIDYTFTPGPFKMYGNGFSLEYLENEMPEWRNSFYDTADCRKAYEKLYYLMVQKDIQWPKTKNRCERFVSAFQQLQDWVKDY